MPDSFSCPRCGHQGRFPASLDTVMDAYNLGGDEFVCPSSHDKPATSTPLTAGHVSYIGWLACNDGAMEIADFIHFDTVNGQAELTLNHVKAIKLEFSACGSRMARWSCT